MPVHFSAIENYISGAYAPKMVKGPAESNGRNVAGVGNYRIDKYTDDVDGLYVEIKNNSAKKSGNFR